MNRTRYAPTPSGYLHLGNLYSFILTATLARREGAAVLLRIDDLDMQRAKPAYVRDIFETLQFFDLPWQLDFTQSGRLAFYSRALEELRQKELVYACVCTRSAQEQKGATGCVDNCRRKNISLDTPSVNWRFISSEGPVRVQLYGSGPVTVVVPGSMKDWIVRKKDAMPSYQLCSVVDEEAMEIDLVVRGEDLWDSTIAQTDLSRQLGSNPLQKVSFWHHRLLLDQQGNKLSKSAGAASLFQLRQRGDSAASILSYLAQCITGRSIPINHWTDLSAFIS